jgi:hypothetical protein
MKPSEHQTELTKIEPPHSILSLKPENRERKLKAIKEKKITHKGKATKIKADFSMETLKARRGWSEVFRALKENNFSPKLLYQDKLSKIDVKYKTSKKNRN